MDFLVIAVIIDISGVVAISLSIGLVTVNESDNSQLTVIWSIPYLTRKNNSCSFISPN